MLGRRLPQAFRQWLVFWFSGLTEPSIHEDSSKNKKKRNEQARNDLAKERVTRSQKAKQALDPDALRARR
jgi:hypothetical protein